ncbi:hypothetical protein [Neobacillus sp. PS3-40]|uniref:hypothetical protein n=1 Tax=Neobacillus sp. PS3-40 TaxID=3070679 RepID=UPI0027DEEE55|nr:hypothetical protein [Neobacillus sp. PS3-40]WML45323.1 hypothetical protein RCG20_05295 [Neobacillus sp. PS3-40]
MKKLLGVLLSLLFIYIVYFDLTVGTLPNGSTKKAEAVAIEKSDSNLPYFKIKVNPGETLISIVEHHANKSLSVPIDDLIRDFKALNPGQSPEKIQIGKIYRFPNYTK